MKTEIILCMVGLFLGGFALGGICITMLFMFIYNI